MRRSTTILALALALLVPPASAAAQAHQVTLRASGTPASVEIAAASGPVVSIPLGKPVQVTVECVAPLRCEELRLSDAAAKRFEPGAGVTDGRFVARLPAAAGPSEIPVELRYGEHPVHGSVTLRAASSSTGGDAEARDTADSDANAGAGAGGGGGGGTGTGRSDEIRALLIAPCSARPPATLQGFVVSPTGAVYSRPERTVNEEDEVVVHVWAAEDLGGRLVAKRTSAARVIQVTNIFGEDAKGFMPTAGGVDCAAHTFNLGQFAPGTGAAAVILHDGEKEQSVSSFDFPVAETFTGSFAIGPMWSTARYPSFSKTFNGTDTLVSVSESRNGRLLYAATYVPYVWGRRDLTRPPARWYEAVNPMVGVVLDKPTENALLGAAFEGPGRISVVAGWHVARVRELDPRSGLVEGGPIANLGADVPTTERWTAKGFWAVTVDVVAALGLLRSTFASPAK